MRKGTQSMKPKTKTHKRKRIKKQTIWLVVGSAALLAVAGFMFFGGNSGEQVTASGAKLVHTMDPSYFSKDPRAEAAYQVARDIPEVLAELPCFCGCMTAFGHESNLFCFRDEHGSGCEICEGIALDARDLHNKGLSIEKIKDEIRQRWAHPH
jgi:hypothetical protein